MEAGGALFPGIPGAGLLGRGLSLLKAIPWGPTTLPPACPLPSLGLTCLGQVAGGGTLGPRLHACPLLKIPWDPPSALAIVRAPRNSFPTALLHGPLDGAGIYLHWAWRNGGAKGAVRGEGAPGRIWKSGGREHPGMATSSVAQPDLCWARTKTSRPVVTSLSLSCPRALTHSPGFVERNGDCAAKAPFLEGSLAPKPDRVPPEGCISQLPVQCYPWTSASSGPGVHPGRPQAPCGQSYCWSRT